MGGGGGCAIKKDGTVWCWGTNRDGELGIGSTVETSGTAQVTTLGTTTTEVVVGTTHACALKKDGTVWCWGADNACQMGDMVRVAECAPLSKTKNWRVVEIVAHAAE
jgi:alpha-tubulin suppressor-like RCC1 family protein